MAGSLRHRGWQLSRQLAATSQIEGRAIAGVQTGAQLGDADPRFEPKERVIGLGGEEDPVAVPLAALARARVVQLEVAGEVVVLWAVEGLRSALDTADIADGREIAASGAFHPEVDGRLLTFAAAGDKAFRDDQTGSTWDVLGRAVDGPLTGLRLEPAEHVNTFWFAWAAFHSETRVAASGT